MSSTELRYWARDDVFAYARRRGRSLRWRRRGAMTAGAAAAVMAMLGLTVGWSIMPASHGTNVHVLNRPTTTVGTVPPPTASAGRPPPSGTTPTSSTATAPSPRPAPAAPPASPSPVASASRPAACIPGDLAMLVTADSPFYPSGMQVHVTAQLTNVGVYVCHLSFTTFGIFDGQGSACAYPEPGRDIDITLKPSQQVQLPFAWNQHCTQRPADAPRLYAPAGHYTAVVTVGWIGTEMHGSAGFDIYGAN